MSAWLFSLLLLVVPPGQVPAREDYDAGVRRYALIADDLAEVTHDPRAAALLVVIAVHEAGLRADVDDLRVLGDGGRACGLFQLQGVRCADVSRAGQARIALARVQQSFRACSGNPERFRLAAYASGEPLAGLAGVGGDRGFVAQAARAASGAEERLVNTYRLAELATALHIARRRDGSGSRSRKAGAARTRSRQRRRSGPDRAAPRSSKRIREGREGPARRGRIMSNPCSTPPSEPVLWVCSLVGASPPLLLPRARPHLVRRAGRGGLLVRRHVHADVVALPEAP